MRHRIIPYNPKLKEFARQRRRKMTLAEVLLWKELRQRKIKGYVFHRQRPIDQYIVDFFCKDFCLAIEVDGWTHGFKKEQDEQRQKRLESLGVRFLRFWDYEIKEHLQSVLKRVDEWIADQEVKAKRVSRKEKTHPCTPPMEGTR